MHRFGISIAIHCRASHSAMQRSNDCSDWRRAARLTISPVTEASGLAAAADPGCDDFASGNADVKFERSSLAVPNLRRRRVHFHCGANGALRIVSMGDGRAEDRHHCVAHPVQHVAAVVRHDLFHRCVEAVQHRL